MTKTQIINRLIQGNYIHRARVNRYVINDAPGTDVNSQGYGFYELEFTRDQIVNMFATCVDQSRELYVLNTSIAHLVVLRNVSPLYHIVGRESDRSAAQSQRPTQQDVPPTPSPVLRTICRSCYHSHGSGTERSGVMEALQAISNDADGVRRSYGLEWEIYYLTEQQEDKLARLLDTLPAHHTERDGSLSDNGVEIIFLPMSESQYVDTVHKLQRFCRVENINMRNTGAHTTYGVSDAQVSRNDLQIRLNRIALAVKAASTQGAIKRVFGRDFTDYARLPQSITYMEHSNAWSASRGDHAYELRLCNWEMNVEKVVEFLKSTEFIFRRPFTARDFIQIFNVMGADCSEA